jgi:hypothetical protein
MKQARLKPALHRCGGEALLIGDYSSSWGGLKHNPKVPCKENRKDRETINVLINDKWWLTAKADWEVTQ